MSRNVYMMETRVFLGESMMGEPTVSGGYASPSDHRACRRLHRQYGTTYYFATQTFPAVIRKRVHALYGFVRTPDEWVDNPQGQSLEEVRSLLANYRLELRRGFEGHCPTIPVLRAFCDAALSVGMSESEPLIFLDAMEQDLEVSRYPTYQDLRHYMRGSASAVGVMMCSMLGASDDDATVEAAKALGEAMQMTNFLRDVAEDARRGRIYLPLEDLERFGVTEDDILAQRMTPEFRNLAAFEIQRTRRLSERAARGIPFLPTPAIKAVRLARVLYSRILDRIEDQEHNVFIGRARTTRMEKLLALVGVAFGRP